MGQGNVGAAVGFVVGELRAGHAELSACKKAFFGAAHVLVVDDRDRHDCSPASQAAHAWHADAPGLENWPLGQGVQVVAPAAAEKLPAGHMVHGAGGYAYMPAGHPPPPPLPPG